MKDFISMQFTGWAVDLLCDVNPDNSPFAAYEGNTKDLYVRCNKAIYGVLSAECYGTHFSPKRLRNMVFPLTLTLTIIWYVDDTKISHVKPSVVTDIIAFLESHFGKMAVFRGERHEFLGMHLHFFGDGTATVHMPSYLQSAKDKSGLPITKLVPTPAAASLLHIETASPLLPVSRARTFHSALPNYR
jgi:hypothetical protein